ncbi:MAG: phasin family protein [Acidiferrobacterales bacterium]
MQYDVFESLAGSTRPGYELARQLTRVNQQLWNILAQQQLDAVALHLDTGIKQLRLLGQVQGLSDLVAGQAQLGQEYVERFMESARQSLVMFSAPAAPTSRVSERGESQRRREIR